MHDNDKFMIVAVTTKCEGMDFKINVTAIAIVVVFY
jgi:hypothetical protein